MTAKEFAEKLDGRELSWETADAYDEELWQNGLVMVFVDWSKEIDFYGAISEATILEAEEDDTIYVAKAGIVRQPLCCLEYDCKYFDYVRKNAKSIRAVRHEGENPCWTFETEIPHETFEIMDYGEVWCKGIVFSMEDV